MKKIGLFGGTFDPIHYGHLRTALEVKMQLELDCVHFIPCHIPPHKELVSVTPVNERKQMLKLALANQPNFILDERELNKDQASYTIDTVSEVAQEMAEAQRFFIMGMDSLVTLHRWHRWQELLEYAHLVIAKRPGSATTEIDSQVAELINKRKCSKTDLHSAKSQEKQGSIIVLETAELEISASHIREQVAAQHAVDYLLPPAVNEYIKAHKLYVSSKENRHKQSKENS